MVGKSVVFILVQQTRLITLSKIKNTSCYKDTEESQRNQLIETNVSCSKYQ